MKVSRIFAGVLIILLGLALFLSNFDVLSLDWHFIFRLWPVLLVFAGISVLVSNSKLKAILYAVTAIMVLVWIFSVASVGWGNFHGLFSGRDRQVHQQEFSQDLEKGIHHAVLSLNSGAGSFFLKDTMNTLFDANTESNIGDYSLNVDKNRDTETLDLSFNGDERNHWRFGGTKNKVNMKLNPNIDWALNMDIGACSVDFDLSQIALTSADIKAGASSLKIKLGDKADTARISVNTGVSSVKIDIPKEIGCQIRDEAKLSSKSFPDFVEAGDGLYRTGNFETAKKIIFISVEAGVSSIKIRKY